MSAPTLFLLGNPSFVKIKGMKEIKGNLISNAVQKPPQELSLPTILVNRRPNMKEGPCMCILLYYPSRRENCFPSAPPIDQPITDDHNSANEKSLNFKLPVYSSGFLYLLQLSQPPTSLHKKASSLLFCGLAFAFAIAFLPHYSPECICFCW